MRIQCQTLFDITATAVTGHIKPSRMPFVDHVGNRITDTETWHRSRNQQRNWETVTQLISLRTQVNDLTEPVQNDHCWNFEFAVDIENLFSDGTDPLAVLKADCEGVPMLTGLNETDNTGVVLAVGENIWFTLTQ
jgi:hypothetical protein